MMLHPDSCSLAWVMMQFLESGHISEVGANHQPADFVVTGFRSLDDVAHLIATVENSFDAPILGLCVLGLVRFRPDKAELLFAAVEPVSGIARCRQEIAALEAELRAGHKDRHGLRRALADWNFALRLQLTRQN
jgi:hypothetical protein